MKSDAYEGIIDTIREVNDKLKARLDEVTKNVVRVSNDKQKLRDAIQEALEYLEAQDNLGAYEVLVEALYGRKDGN